MSKLTGLPSGGAGGGAPLDVDVVGLVVAAGIGIRACTAEVFT